jgi:Glycosyltransferase family 87
MIHFGRRAKRNKFWVLSDSSSQSATQNPKLKTQNYSMGPRIELKTRKLLSAIVIGLWAAVLLGVCLRIGLMSHSHDVFVTYYDAGRKWVESQSLYSYTRGFVYSPLVAAFFVLFSWLPLSLGAVLWRLIDVAVFVGAILWWLKAEIHDRISKSSYWLVFLLILPLSLGNFNNGQINPLIIGLLMVAMLAARDGQWTLSAICVGVCTYLKIYPLSVGLLLVLIYPRDLGWRVVLTLILMGLLPFILQRPAYVFEQYQRWFSFRAADDRRMNMDIAPRDFAMILRMFSINLSASVFLLVQILAGAAAAAVCLIGRLRKWSEERLLICILTLGTCWMLLFGPATEDATYAMIAPALSFAVVQAFSQSTPSWMRGLICISYAVLLVGLILNAFFGLKKTPYSMSVQPCGALLFAGYTLIWVFSSSLWKPALGKRAGVSAFRRFGV